MILHFLVVDNQEVGIRQPSVLLLNRQLMSSEGSKVMDDCDHPCLLDVRELTGKGVELLHGVLQAEGIAFVERCEYSAYGGKPEEESTDGSSTLVMGCKIGVPHLVEEDVDIVLGLVGTFYLDEIIHRV